MSPIEVILKREGDLASLEIRDRGPGIPPEDLTRIFGRFERAVPMANYGGLGLGLFISNQIAQAHGGSIQARNAPDGGAVFTAVSYTHLTLPTN